MSLTMIASPRAATQPAIPCPAQPELAQRGQTAVEGHGHLELPFSRKSNDPASAFMTSWIMSMV